MAVKMLKAAKYFSDLANCIREAWLREGGRPEVFAQASYAVLSEFSPASQLTLRDCLEFGLASELLPRQADLEAKFGQPPLTVHWDQDFRIEVLFWREGECSIHQHAFSGAFHVVLGSTLHLQWVFDSSEQLELGLYLGDLSLHQAEILMAGETRMINSGPAFIHSTYHLECPTITIVVRTHHEMEYSSQLVYFRPNLAVSPTLLSPDARRRLQILHFLAHSNQHSQIFEFTDALFDQHSAISVFHYIFTSHFLLKDNDDRERLLSIAAKKWPTLIRTLRPILRERERQIQISFFKERLLQAELRSFVSLLMNIPHRSGILQAVSSGYNKNHSPREHILDQLRLLATIGPKDPLSNSWLPAVRAAQVLLAQSGRLEQLQRTEHSPLSILSEQLETHWLVGPLFHETTCR